MSLPAVLVKLSMCFVVTSICVCLAKQPTPDVFFTNSSQISKEINEETTEFSMLFHENSTSWNEVSTDGQREDGQQEESAPSTRAAASQMLAYRVAGTITRYGTPVIIVIGMVGNTLSLMVMLQPHNRRISCCVYMAALSVMDSLVLVISGYYWGVTQFRGGFHRAECKILDFLLVASSFGGILYIVGMTGDRVVAVRFPLHSRAWCTPKRARISVGVLTSFALAYNAPYIFITTEDSNGLCSTEAYKNSYVTFYAWLGVFLNSVFPFTVLSILNGIIIITIRNRKKFFLKDTGKDKGNDQGKGQGHSRGQDDTKARERQLMVMLILVSLAVLLLTLPRYIRYAVFSFVHAAATPKRLAEYILATHITARLYTINNAVNFFLYCLGGSKFREDLSKLCCRSLHGSREDTSSVNNATEVSQVNTSF